MQTCEVCQQAKTERNRSPGLLQPHKIPPEAWHTVSLDFIEVLPKSGKFDTIMVVIDKFSKVRHFIPLKHPFTAAIVAQLYMDQVYRLHGMPEVLISDRDKIFISNFWQQLFNLADTTLNLSSSYHPQTDGQTERLNQCLETYLHCMVHSKPRQWAKWLPQAEHWYNTAFHSSLGRSPFEVLYGRSPRNFGVPTAPEGTNSDLTSWLEERAEMLPLFKRHPERAQQRMTSQANKKRLERNFQVGDRVYLRLQPYVQQSLEPRSSQKLSFRYFGPYTILQRIGPVAYKLDLPPTSRIHPVVHVSLLKKALRAGAVAAASLPVAIVGSRK